VIRERFRCWPFYLESEEVSRKVYVAARWGGFRGVAVKFDQKNGLRLSDYGRSRVCLAL